MEWLIEIGVFSGKSLIIVFSIIVILITFFSLLLKMKPEKQVLTIENLNKKFEGFQKQLRFALEDEKSLTKELKKKEKQKKKQRQSEKDKKTIFVLKFDGDIKASAAESFRDEITSTLSVAKPDKDEVVVVLESTGGMVHAYGMAASQLQRIKNAGIRLTVCVDKVAASGGYMMACTADRILAAPFSILGSIGVIAQVPNLHRLLNKWDVDYEEVTAGDYKRTISLFGEITDKGKKKFIEQIEDTHGLFKDFVKKNRPSLDIDKVATGEYWYGIQAKELGLIDDLKTSDEYLFSMKDSAKLLLVQLQEKKKLGDRLSEAIEKSISRAMTRFIQENRDSHLLS